MSIEQPAPPAADHDRARTRGRAVALRDAIERVRLPAAWLSREQWPQRDSTIARRSLRSLLRVNASAKAKPSYSPGIHSRRTRKAGRRRQKGAPAVRRRNLKEKWPRGIAPCRLDPLDRLILDRSHCKPSKMGHTPGGFRLWWRPFMGSDATLDNARWRKTMEPQFPKLNHALTLSRPKVAVLLHL